MRRLCAFLMLLLLLGAPLGAYAQDEHLTPQAVLESMTLEEKVAQMFLARCPSSEALKTVTNYQPGGYILFSDHFKEQTPDSIKERIDAFQDASRVPMLIGVDEEGGTVTRVSRHKAFRDAKYQSPRALFEAGGLVRIAEDAREKSELLLSLGVNFNLAPVCDMSKSGDFMYARSMGDDTDLVSLYAVTVTRAMQESGILSALKHFPGYGGNSDTHVGFAVDKRDYETFLARDMQPFKAAIDAGAGCVLVSHNIVNCMDADAPASLSPEVHRVLREELGFTGVIMTDDLYMQAIRDFVGVSEAAVRAVEAGNDLLCCTDFKTQYAAVLGAVESGRIDESRIDESVLRILKWKERIELL